MLNYEELKKKQCEYNKKYREKYRDKILAQKKIYYRAGKKYVCKICGTEYERNPYCNAKYCSRKCFAIDQKEKRKGKKNPNFKTGLYINGKYSTTKTGAHHLYECGKYKLEFLEKHDYLYCENCGVSNSIRYEVHHIVFASEAPKHPQLHNRKNMILTCIKCHNFFHKNKKNRNKLVIKRGLEEIDCRACEEYQRSRVTSDASLPSSVWICNSILDCQFMRLSFCQTVPHGC